MEASKISCLVACFSSALDSVVLWCLRITLSFKPFTLIRLLFEDLHQRNVVIEALTTSLGKALDSKDMLHMEVRFLVSCINSYTKKVANLKAKLREAESKSAETEKKLEMSSEKIDGLRLVIQDMMKQAQTQTEREETLNRHVQELEVFVIARTEEKEELLETSEENNQEISSFQAQLDNIIQRIKALDLCGSSTSYENDMISPFKQISATHAADYLSHPQKEPVGQILRLEERLLKYFQVEDKVQKKVKDLEEKNEELLLEQEYLLETISEQHLRIERLRTKLEKESSNEPAAHTKTILRLRSKISKLINKTVFDKQVLHYKDVKLNEMKARLKRESFYLAGKKTKLLKDYQSKIEAIRKLRDEISILTSSLSEKDKEILCQKKYLKKKDKIIQTMKYNCKSLHSSLVMIHAKIKESENVLDLRKKLKDARRNNAKLLKIITMLKTDLEINTLRPSNIWDE
ncbi:protein lava lamp-like [Copidosoma floridanum]|uniref:protein lava lamp-like n=1 Tax=Copidosoma floridanum TaxID=29053 RepID=UPI000C6F5B5E|nr:protein lava lamp-like [Copidosoma floridanum]